MPEHPLLDHSMEEKEIDRRARRAKREYTSEEDAARRRKRREAREKIKEAEESISQANSYHAEQQHFYEAYRHVGKRVFAIIVSGAGFLADSYDLFLINIALAMMKQNPRYGVLTPEMQSRISIMAILGALAGQTVFGVLGDQFGRKATFISTAGLTIAGTLMQVCASPNPLLGMNIWQQMCFFRFMLGMGVGGEYPMASTITSECSTPETRGRNLAGLFSMQGVGRVFCAAVLLLSAFTIKDTNWQWRFVILMGSVPMMVVFYFRWLPETELYTREVVIKFPTLKARYNNIWLHVWQNRNKLVGTAGAWFLVDVVFYGNSLFSAEVTRAMGTEDNLRAKTVQNLCIQLMAMPGYILSIFFLDRIGRKRLQLFGFTGMTIVFLLMACFLQKLKSFPAFFVVFYALTFFFDDFGPNTTTFIIPAEIYPTASRSTCHGISAAFGKVGAALGGTVFLKVTNHYCPGHQCTKHTDPALQDKGIRLVFVICSIVACIGILWTWFLVDDTPHESLGRAGENKYGNGEHDKDPGELEALELAISEGNHFLDRQ